MTELAGRKVSIIGGAGFIGHHVALDLAARGADVQVIDGLQVNNIIAIASTGPEHELRGLYMRMLHERLDLLRAAEVPVIVQDARDYFSLNRLLNEFRPHAIVHLAAVSHAGQSNKDPYSTFDHSLRTLENALDTARGVGVEQFVFLSSSMVYGDFLTAEVTEDHPLNSIGIYGALKVAGEKIVVAYQQVFDLTYTIVRPSALYGARCVSRRVGQRFIERALRGSTLRIQGDGSDRLDFTYIDDLVQGVRLTLTRPEAHNEIFNLTYGAARTVGEVADIVRSEFPGIEVEYAVRDRLMPFRGTLSVEKARRLIGYEPVNPVDVGFPKYVEWYRQLVAAAPEPLVMGS
jgi:nucleoside-diphosphate-sugar epimerase